MNLDQSQKQKVSAWIAEGLKLAEIQKRLVSEFGVNLTYMEVRFLVDDLKLVPKDPAVPQAPVAPKAEPALPPPPGTGTPASAAAGGMPGPETTPAPGGNVSVNVDAVTRPGALVSGSVSFSDGQTAAWYLDQMGRLGIAPQQQGYKPSAADLEAFQRGLETELSKLGF